MTSAPSPVPVPGQVALVTGASRGLGQAIARLLLDAGLSVALVARTAEAMEPLAASAPGRTLVLPMDLADSAAGAQAVARAEAVFGPLHVVIHAAAPYFEMQRLVQVDDAAVSMHLQTSVGVAAGLCRAALPGMLGHRFGRLVVISSLAAQVGAAGSPLYAAGKAGMEGLVRALAVDHGRHGITANAIGVSFVDTPRLQQRTTPDGREKLAQATALRRIPTAAEVAAVVGFVCSPAGGLITGSVVPADAGAHLNCLW